MAADHVIIAHRHGRQIRFPPVPNATEQPYTYRPLTTGGWYEEQFLERITRDARRGVYVDVGAHLGTHTAWFAMLCPSTHVHAIEPVSRFADQIQRVVEANGLQQKVTVHRLGVADEPGHVHSTLSPEHQVGFDPAGEASIRQESFPVSTLDELIDSGPVAVIKLDVEGMEARVLSGATRLLSENRPVVYAEALDRSHLRTVAEVLKRHGYRSSGRVFNGAQTYEFIPARPWLPLVAAARRASRFAKLATRGLWWRLTRRAA
jgi:FkbM family methyltransferase